MSTEFVSQTTEVGVRPMGRRRSPQLEFGTLTNFERILASFRAGDTFAPVGGCAEEDPTTAEELEQLMVDGRVALGQFPEPPDLTGTARSSSCAGWTAIRMPRFAVKSSTKHCRRSGDWMTSGAGRLLLEFLEELQATTRWAVTAANAEVGALSRWQLSGLNWRAIVTVEPHRWLGLEFETRDPVTGKRATYDIDTDLYDISKDDNREFSDEIERDIIEFLDNLRKGAVLRGNEGKKFVLVFPREGSYVRVIQGRFASGASTHADLASARVGEGDYVPVE
ncbi:hypothetical protein AB0F91_43805 [Amycolatopsis sp. NPDC023774]|uniref:hypothetical protein n=1 Tax=Amycolatopsis sp. NPDC023774 TaxID=3155015 RepID=UPI0033F0C26D